MKPTPIEKYRDVWVKREDLAFPKPAPPFSKCRGLMRRMKALKESGVSVVGYTESAVSMAGWGVCWVAKELGMTAVIFDPQYKNVTPRLLRYHRRRWEQFGAVIVPVRAQRVKVSYHANRKWLEDHYPGAVMLPLGLPFSETIEETAKEVETVLEEKGRGFFKSVVVNVGSGTVAAGVLRGFQYEDVYVYGVMGRSGSVERTKNKIYRKAEIVRGGLLAGKNRAVLKVIDPGWEYTERSFCSCPFPSHPWYDLKAWQWLQEKIGSISQPILFWNIGRIG